MKDPIGPGISLVEHNPLLPLRILLYVRTSRDDHRKRRLDLGRNLAPNDRSGELRGAHGFLQGDMNPSKDPLRGRERRDDRTSRVA